MPTATAPMYQPQTVGEVHKTLCMLGGKAIIW